MEITYLNDAVATPIASSLPVASAAVRLTTPHVVSASRGELCPQATVDMRPRATVQHQISALVLTIDAAVAVATDAAKRDIATNGTNGFAKHHPGSRTLRPPV